MGKAEKVWDKQFPSLLLHSKNAKTIENKSTRDGPSTRLKK